MNVAPGWRGANISLALQFQANLEHITSAGWKAEKQPKDGKPMYTHPDVKKNPLRNMIHLLPYVS